VKEQTKEIMFSLLNIVVLGIIFTGLLNILVQEYRCSGGTETANPAAGNRCSETGIPHLVTSYLCEFTRLKLDLIHILPAWTCNYLGLSG
jgi:hypothetical protein